MSKRFQNRRRPDAAPQPPSRPIGEALFGYLARREYSQKELHQRLALRGYPEEAITAALAAAADSGAQSDIRYAESMVRVHAARHGARRIRRTLAAAGVEGSIIEAATAQAAPELTRAIAVMQRFAEEAPTPALRARLTRRLAARGFGFDVIASAWRVVFEGAAAEDFEA